MRPLELSEVVRNWAIVGGGAVGFGIAIWRARVADRAARTQALQAEMDRRKQVVAMFETCAERLSSEKRLDRMAAIILLEDLVQRYPDLAAPALRLLQTFLDDFRHATGDAGLGPDHIEALQVLMRRSDPRPDGGPGDG